ncbi:MAG: UPF0175 family protein [Verrucomicrobiaceae bacterium]|nr:UPF0175 family protein [Verrucomicrobiaceae bacterium]
MNVTLEIPDKELVSLAAEASAAPLKRRVVTELALVLYGQGMLPVGKAMELAGMTRREFHQLVHARGVTHPFDEEELVRDLAWGETK